MFSNTLSLCLVFSCWDAEAEAVCLQGACYAQCWWWGHLFVKLHQTLDESDLRSNLDFIYRFMGIVLACVGISMMMSLDRNRWRWLCFVVGEPLIVVAYVNICVLQESRMAEFCRSKIVKWSVMWVHGASQGSKIVEWPCSPFGGCSRTGPFTILELQNP